MTYKMTEEELEEAAILILQELGYDYIWGPDIAPEAELEERKTFEEPILTDRLKSKLKQLNPNLPPENINEVFNQITRINSPNLITNNQSFHKSIIEGVTTSYNHDGRTKTVIAKVIDFENVENNEFLAINQYTVIQKNGSNIANRRPDIVLFINGLPIVVIELKNPADENTTIYEAYNQIITYKNEISSLFTTNELIIISDGYEARAGSLSANWERFTPWRTIEGEVLADPSSLQLEVLFRGLLDQERLLDYIQSFITYEETQKGQTIKIAAAYHQYHAVNRSITETFRATQDQGDKKIGVIWHTQGSGKSLTMLFYAGKLVQHFSNPTILILTDRNDLDNQLYETFHKNKEILRQDPKQADTRKAVKDLLQTKGGGIIFSTIQKFLPEGEEEFPQLSDRQNIIVMADEAHRSQYSFQKSSQVKYDTNNKLQNILIKEGFAAHIRNALPNASYIGFTGTPIDLVDRNTIQVFGDYISVYDISQAILDNTTVPIYYEARQAKIKLNKDIENELDGDFDDITEDEEVIIKEKLKSKWSTIAELVSDPDRLEEVANDIINHFENRLEIFEGKGMIVCMTRKICVLLYDAIVKIKPEWHSDDDNEGIIKVVMSGSASDDQTMQPHIRSKQRRTKIEQRVKDPNDKLKLVIVRDMWLTGFDVPSLHTMYIDKPMKGHNLMQAIARVNRVWKNKPGGLIVDYIGVGYYLKLALSKYSNSSRKETAIPQEEAVKVMKIYYETMTQMFHNFDYSPFFEGNALDRIRILPAAMEHILQLEHETPETAKKLYLDNMASLEKAFSLALPHENAMVIRDDIAFFQAIKIGFTKSTSSLNRDKKSKIDFAIKQLISKAVVSEDIIDIFEATGIQKPEVSILSNKFLDEIKNFEHKNLAVELLNKLLQDQIKSRSKSNLVQSKSFKELLKKSLNRYNNRTIESAAVIIELIELAKQMQEAYKKGDELGLNENEIAFYEALAAQNLPVTNFNDETLKEIARELVSIVRKSATIDFTVRNNVQARMKIEIRKLLRKYDYPQEKTNDTIKQIMEQTLNFGEEWALA